MFPYLLNFASCQHILYCRKAKRQRNVFLDVNIIREPGEFTTSVYRKSTFSGICTHFDSFLPSAYKIGMIHTLLYRCFRICSYWTKFHLELVKLMDVFRSSSWAENFINNYFKTFLDNKYRIKEKITTVPRKTLCLVHLLTLDQYHCKLESYLKNFSKVFFIVGNY